MATLPLLEFLESLFKKLNYPQLNITQRKPNIKTKVTSALWVNLASPTMRAAGGTPIALLGWLFLRICSGLIIPGHLEGPPTVHPGRERPIELRVPDTAAPNLPPSPTTEVVSGLSYFRTIPTSKTLLTIPKPTITTPPHVLDKKWETVISEPFFPGGAMTITDPSGIFTCVWTSSQTFDFFGKTITPGYTIVFPGLPADFPGSDPANPCEVSGFSEVTTVPSTWTELASSAAMTTTNTSVTTSTSQEINGYGGGYRQHNQERAEAATVPKTSGFTATIIVTISATQHSSGYSSTATPQPYEPHNKRWTTITVTDLDGKSTATDLTSTLASFSGKRPLVWMGPGPEVGWPEQQRQQQQQHQ